MSYKIQDLEGIGPAYADKLAAADIENTRSAAQAVLRYQGPQVGRRKDGPE